MMPSKLPVEFDCKTEWVLHSISIQVGEKLDSKIIHKGFACMCPVKYFRWMDWDEILFRLLEVYVDVGAVHQNKHLNNELF